MNSLKNILLFYKNIAANKSLIIALVRKDLLERYANSIFGVIWAVIQPLLTITVYSIVFSLIMRATIPDTYKPVPFAIFFLSGIIPYQIFSETVQRSSTVLLDNISMITKTLFPYELLPISILITSFMTGMISIIILFILMLIFGIFPNFINLLYLPLFFLPLLLLSMGIAWIASIFSAVFKDFTHIIPVILNVLFFGCPIVYSYQVMESFGKNHPILLFLAKTDPLYSIIIGHRTSFIGKDFFLDAESIIITYLISIAVFLIGGIIFYFFKRELADLL